MPRPLLTSVSACPRFVYASQDAAAPHRTLTRFDFAYQFQKNIHASITTPSLRLSRAVDSRRHPHLDVDTLQCLWDSFPDESPTHSLCGVEAVKWLVRQCSPRASRTGVTSQHAVEVSGYPELSLFGRAARYSG